ncbi:MAG TPA: hypothetical protein VII25_10555 [Candidatus Acidoferrum sp.]
MSRHRSNDTPSSFSAILTRRELLAALGTCVGGSLFYGCAGVVSANHPNPVPAPSPAPAPAPPSPPPVTTSTQPVPSGPITLSTVAVSSAVTANIPAFFAGLSYEKGALPFTFFSSSNTGLVALFRRLGAGVFRLGGSSVDKTFWNHAGPGLTPNEIAPADIDRLAAFLTATGWPILYGVNLARSTAAEAADEVAYAVKSFGSLLAGIEIGNEPDLYPGTYFPANWSFADYLVLWKNFESAIRVQSPHAPLTGPVVAYNNTWFASFAQNQAKNLALLSRHYYRGDGHSPSSTIAEMLSYPDTNLQKVLQPVHAAANAAAVPFRVAETNSFYHGGAPGVSNAYASALWVIDHLFTMAQGGAVGVNLHGGGDGPGYTPIADHNSFVVEARPEYYGVLLFTLAGQGALLTTTIAAASLNTSAFTIKNSSTKLSIIIVNKDATQNLHFTAACPSTVHSATLLELTGPSLHATSGLTIQGSPVHPDGSFNPKAPYTLSVSSDTFTGYVPAASAVLITITLA